MNREEGENQEEDDIIIGPHSIECALKNPRRRRFRLVGIEEGVKKLRPLLKEFSHSSQTIDIEVLSKEHFSHFSHDLFQKRGFSGKRVPGGVILLSDQLPLMSPHDFYQQLEREQSRSVIALDQVSDIHNMGAVARTCAFYGVKFLLFQGKTNWRSSPGLYHVASGALEFVSFVATSSLPRTLKQLQSREIRCIGLSEKSSLSLRNHSEKSDNLCVVFGAEDSGLSHAVQRQLDETYRLEGGGELGTLNISVACAISSEILFSTSLS